MLVSQAHSFKQQARLAISLAWIGGYTNVVTLFACGTVSSHVSGTTSNLGRDLFSGEWRLAGYACFLLACFFVGAAISGFCTEFGRRRGWESIYVLPLIVEAMLLAVFALALAMSDPAIFAASPMLYWMTGTASMAMGLQNATITRISSGTVRTTHVTGVLTDFGHEIVQLLWRIVDQNRNVPSGSQRGLVRSMQVHTSARRLFLLASIFVTFAIGSGLGTLLYLHAMHWAMFPPVVFIGWIVYQDITKPIAEIEPSLLFNKQNGLDLPSAIAVYHLRKDHDRKGEIHRLPNLLAWSERLPEKVRVVILDLMETTHWDDNAVMELRAVLKSFESQGRELIIAGLSSERLGDLNGDQNRLSFENACSDLELAVARGLNLLEIQVSKTTTQ